MLKILGISGSLRENGNTEYLVRHALSLFDPALIFLKGDVVNLLPEKSLPELRGFLRGMDISGWREEDERI